MKKMFWVDLEMTGLDPMKDRILEAAVIVTDLDLNELDTLHRIVYQDRKFLDNMNDWCKETHGKSGLTKLVPDGDTIEKVEKEMLELALKHFPGNEKVVLCGNSVNMDRLFIEQYMPNFSRKMHYRVVDVTSFKEVFRSKWGVTIQKAEGHRALDDIKESIKELQHYLQFIKVDENAEKAGSTLE